MPKTTHILLKPFLAILFWLTTCFVGFSQTFPIYVMPTLTPPHSLVLADYAKPGAQNLVVTLMVNDVTIANLPVRLHLRIETATGIVIENIPAMNARPIYLNGGQVAVLFGSDLADNFNINNLQFRGISREEYRRTGQIPAGFYRFTVEVRHFITGRLISNQGSVRAWMALGRPPELRNPANEAEMGQIPGAPLVFSWQPAQLGIPGGSVRYLFEMWEMRVPNISPFVYAASMPVFHSETTSATALSIPPAALFLEPGMKYAWRVTAFDPSGFIPFIENGHSEVRTFVYQSRCDEITNLTINRTGRNVAVRWRGAPNHTSFFMEVENPNTDYRRRFQLFDSRFDLFNVEEGKTYNIRIQAVCGGNENNLSDFTQWHTFSIPERQTAENHCPECACDAQFENVPITNFERREVQPGDTIRLANNSTRFIIKTAEEQPNGAQRGVFLFLWEYFGIKILCNYWDLTVNTDNVILTYDFESVFNPNLLLDVDEIENFIRELTNNFTNNRNNDTISINFVIPDEDSFVFNCQPDTDVCELTIHGEDGETQTVIVLRDDDGNPVLPKMIEGADGNVFLIENTIDNELVATFLGKNSLEEVVVRAFTGDFEVVINNDTTKVTTDTRLRLVYQDRPIHMELRRTDGDTINPADIRWEIREIGLFGLFGRTETIDSTLTTELTIDERNVRVRILEREIDDRGRIRFDAIGEFTFVPRRSPYVTLSTLPGYDGEFGFDDAKDFIDHPMPNQYRHYRTIEIPDRRNRTRTLYVPWLTLVQGQTVELRVTLSQEIEGDDIYIRISNGGITARYDHAQQRLFVTNNSLNNNFDTPVYISFYRDDQYGLQREQLIGKLAVVGRPLNPRIIPVQIIYFATDTTNIRNTVDRPRLQRLLNSHSMNQAFAQFEVLPNIIRIQNELDRTTRANHRAAYDSIQAICRNRGMNIEFSRSPDTIYVVLTDLEFKTMREEGGARITETRGGGVMFDGRLGMHNNLAVMWVVPVSGDQRERFIIHEIGHTLGLRDTFNDETLGRPPRGFSRHNYMDYIRTFRMFFKTQIETIINNLRRGEEE